MANKSGCNRTRRFEGVRAAYAEDGATRHGDDGKLFRDRPMYQRIKRSQGHKRSIVAPASGLTLPNTWYLASTRHQSQPVKTRLLSANLRPQFVNKAAQQSKNLN